MPKAFKRYLPLVGTAVVTGSVLAKALGFDGVGQALDTVGSLTGLSGESIVTGAAATAFAGFCLKVIALVKGKDSGEFVSPR